MRDHTGECHRLIQARDQSEEQRCRAVDDEQRCDWNGDTEGLNEDAELNAKGEVGGAVPCLLTASAVQARRPCEMRAVQL
jgi:hypothetical protein